MYRVGLGYDIHKLREGRRLVLGGVEIAHPVGLDGHSDADVVLHAIMDAILGAAALGDIGRHFPPSDEAYRDADSVELLGRVSRLVAGSRWRVVNVDATIVAEHPKIAPHVSAMCARIAGTLGIEASAVSVKATTNERLGPEGRMEGISALAIVGIERESRE